MVIGLSVVRGIVIVGSSVVVGEVVVTGVVGTPHLTEWTSTLQVLLQRPM